MASCTHANNFSSSLEMSNSGKVFRKHSEVTYYWLT